MIYTSKGRLLTGASALGLALALSAPAFAEERDVGTKDEDRVQVAQADLAGEDGGVDAGTVTGTAGVEERRTVADTLTVTAERREASAQDVPIAVTAYDANALDAYQIEDFSDLQFGTPNVSFTKTNFTGSNFAIRGIGTSVTAASGDSGTGIHINDVPLRSPRLFEAEFYDVERIEVLRGPQGTLYGRNASAGVVNLITAKPIDEFEVKGEVDIGNFSSYRFKGAVNLPVTDDLAFRVAGLWHQRDGFTENIFTGNDIDDRDLYSFRVTGRWWAGPDTRVTAMFSYFNEDDRRSRVYKQLCKKDPSAVYGCLPDELAFETANGASTLGGLFGGYAGLSGIDATYDGNLANSLGLLPFPDPYANSVNPADLRQVSADLDPRYKADERFFTFEINHAFEKHELTYLLGVQDTTIQTLTDYDWTVASEPFVPAGLAALVFPTGEVPVSRPNPPSHTGSLGGSILTVADRTFGADISSGDGNQFTHELRFASSYDGPFNFLLGAFYMDHEGVADYYVLANTLDAFSISLGAIGAVPGGLIAPYFFSDTDRTTLKSKAVFGEVYWDFLPNAKLTAGLRYTDDEKTVRDRQLLWNGPGVLDIDDLVPYRNDEADWQEFTGRIGVDWMVDTGFTDDTLLYAFFSRGYKGGGFNPPFDPTLFPGINETFDPEFIDAYEIGAKNTLMGGDLIANLTGFYYDYQGLQISKIVNRTSVNENIDATIWGIEGEFLWSPTANLLFNTSFGYLNTDIGESVVVDPRDPTAGDPSVVLLKDVNSAANCIRDRVGTEDRLQFGDCAALAATPGNPFNVRDGIPVNLEGNQLRNAPEFSIRAGAQYSYPFQSGFELVGRVDYYWQGESWGRIFNRDPIDRIDGYDIWNMSLTLAAPEDQWFVEAWVQNLEDDDNITGMYVTDASSGLFTNVFLTDPRTYGVTLGVHY